MRFECKGYSKAGDVVVEVLEAPDAGEALERLRRRGVFAVEAVPVGEGGAAATKRTHANTAGRANPRLLAIFAREMSVLVSTGTPVVEALMALERQSHDERWSAVLHDVRQRVEEGTPLSEAMGSHPGAFDAVTRSLIAAGESSGQLDAMLTRLAVLTRRQLAARRAVGGALVYPALLIVVAAVVLTLMIVFVLPRFGGLFETLDSPLPPTTGLLMLFSAFVRAYWWGLLPALAMGGAGAVLWLRSARGKAALDTAVLRAPRVGPIARSFATARIARLLGVLLESRVPLMEALELTKASMGNEHYRALLQRAESQVTKGESVSAAFGASALIAPSVCEAIRNGEQSGRLAPVLLSVADYLDDENETVIKSLSTLLEPVIMIVLGLVVGFIAISMFLPLFDLTASAGGGPSPGGAP